MISGSEQNGQAAPSARMWQRQPAHGRSLMVRAYDAAIAEKSIRGEACAAHSDRDHDEQEVIGGMHRAFAAGRDLETADVRYVAEEMVPLYQTYEEPIKALRE